MVSRHFGSEWVPYVLVTRNQSDRGSECEIVKDLGSLLALNGGVASCELRDIVLQWPANFVVKESHSETVIFPPIKETTGKQCDAGVAGNRICLFRRISRPSKYTDTAKRMSAPELLSFRRGVPFYKKILREIPNRGPAIGLEVDRQATS